MSSQQAIAPVSKNPITPFRQAFEVAEAQFRRALPATVAKYLTPDRLTKVALNAIGRTPLLLQCSPNSVLKSVMDAASLGLEAGSPLGHAYLVPFRGKNGYECQLIIGYRGLIELARRSGKFKSVEAHVVYEFDTFEISFGREPTLKHTPKLEGERGNVRAAYCVANLSDGATHVEFMTRADLDHIRSKSKAKDNGPWVTDFAEMCRKSVVRRASKYWPLCVELAEAMEVEQKHGEADVVNNDNVMIFEGEAIDEGDTPQAQSLPPASTDRVLEKLKSQQQEAPVANQTPAPDSGLEEAEKRWEAEKAAKEPTESKPKSKGKAKAEAAPTQQPSGIERFHVAVANAKTEAELDELFKKTGHMAAADIPAARGAIAKRRAELEFDATTDKNTGEVLPGQASMFERQPGEDDDKQPAGSDDGWR